MTSRNWDYSFKDSQGDDEKNTPTAVIIRNTNLVCSWNVGEEAEMERFFERNKQEKMEIETINHQ